MRAKVVGAGLLVFAAGALVGWAIASVVDDSASSDEVATIADDVGALEATVAALADDVAETSGEVAALEDDVATSAGRFDLREIFRVVQHVEFRRQLRRLEARVAGYEYL